MNAYPGITGRESKPQSVAVRGTMESTGIQGAGFHPRRGTRSAWASGRFLGGGLCHFLRCALLGSLRWSRFGCAID